MNSVVPNTITTTHQLQPQPESQRHNKMDNTYDELNMTIWNTVPILREERDEGRMVPELGVSPRAIKQYRVRTFTSDRIHYFLVVETVAYNNIKARQVINCNHKLSTKTLHGKKVVVTAITHGDYSPTEFAFTDDECAFGFQMEIETALADLPAVRVMDRFA